MFSEEAPLPAVRLSPKANITDPGPNGGISGGASEQPARKREKKRRGTLRQNSALLIPSLLAAIDTVFLIRKFERKDSKNGAEKKKSGRATFMALPSVTKRGK